MQKTIVLSKRPGPEFPKDISLLQLKYQQIPSINELNKNENLILIKVYFISVDPVMRVWMSGAKTYLPSLPLNETMFAFGIGEVVHSNNKKFKKGDIVTGELKMAQYSLIDISKDKFLSKIPFLIPEIPLHYYLNVIGINGFTAYQGLIGVGKAKKGETVVVSAAAGATGIFVCQFAKNLGCRVIGLTGSEVKCQFLLKELGIDGVINYTEENNLKEALERNCPNGIDVYFDNVGEEILDTVLALMNVNGRIALSGAMKTYKNRVGLVNYPQIIFKRIMMRGFTFNECFDNLGESVGFILELIREKKLIIKEEILEGLEKAPIGLQKLFLRQNIGKILIKVDENYQEKNNSKL